jgi:DNA polymerase elongation subunit (family B)
MKDPNELKILLLDMELTFAIYYAYPSKKEQYLSASNIIHDQFCTCAAWKWLDETTTHVVRITDDKKAFKKDFRNDRNIAVKLHELMEKADIIVAHNGDSFDLKHARTLFRKHGLGPIPKRKSIDTLKISRRLFAFPGNSLDQLSKRFGSVGKNKKPNWYKMTDGDAKEINTAARYCKNDVIELEKIFNELKPYIENFPTLRKYKDHITECEVCRSKLLRNKGLDFDGYKQYRRIKCNECGHNHKCHPNAKIKKS